MAQQRARDWIVFLERYDLAVAEPAVELLITSPQRPRFIGISDLHGVIQQQAHHRQLDQPRALPEPRISEEAYHRGLFAARCALANAKPAEGRR